MFKFQINSKGIALYMVLTVLLIVVIFANIILSFILSQSQLTHHQVKRIQAYYAAQAGMNYALEKLRTGAWTYPTNCPNPASGDPTCTVPETGPDTDFPKSIVNQRAYIVFCPPGTTCYKTTTPCSPPTGINFCVSSTANYTSD